MCGIAICFSTTEDVDAVTRRLSAMEAVQRHRGPDDQGILTKPVGRGVLGFGQQRLSILDLTPAGHQPMVSPCGRYALNFNGEVYNYKELAAELRGEPAVAPILEMSSGDTAVVLAALVRWGCDAFRRFNGMWTIAFVDWQEARLVLSRDRLGVKPLYMAQEGGTLVISSEIKGVLAGSAGRRFALDTDVIARYLLQSLIAAQPETFFRGVDAFPPASYADIDLRASSIDVVPKAFWRHPFEEPRAAAPAPTADDVRELFMDSVRLRLRADVPVGVMLSGGLDSSSILVAARKAHPNADLRALSVVSRDPATNEEPFIDRMVKHVGCDVIKVQSDDDPSKIWDDFSNSVWHFDHPVTSFSAIAHRAIIRRAREHGMIVLLTGQGSDEQLGGYNKFLYFYLWDRLRRARIGGPMSMLAGCLLHGTILREFTVQHAKRYIPFLREKFSRGWIGPALADAKLLNTGLGASYEEREWRDLRQFSLPLLLTSEDRMSMSWSTEMRTPFLDYRLVEALGRVPPEAKLRHGWTKHILRRAMDDLLPPEITWRKDKKGYSLPGDTWMRTSLRPRVDEVLQGRLMAADLGLVDAAGARGTFADFLAGRSGIRYQDVLAIVSLEMWLQRFAPFIQSGLR